MFRKLMLPLIAACALAGCDPNARLGSQDICADVGFWNGDGEYETKPVENCPVPSNETDVVLPGS